MSEQEYNHIVRVAGRDIDGQENLIQGLSRIKGVGLRISKTVVSQLDLDPRSRLGYLDDKTIEKIEDMLGNPMKSGFPSWQLNRQRDRRSGRMIHLTGADLEFTRQNDIERLKRIRSWRGTRHSLGLKVRGQHTRTTGRSGMSVGVSRKKLIQKAKAERED